MHIPRHAYTETLSLHGYIILGLPCSYRKLFACGSPSYLGGIRGVSPLILPVQWVGGWCTGSYIGMERR